MTRARQAEYPHRDQYALAGQIAATLLILTAIGGAMMLLAS